MKNIQRLRAIKFITEQQAATAFLFFNDPNRFRLSPTLFGILREAVIEEKSLEAMEEDRGWPARSAKAIVSVILHSMEETRGAFWSDGQMGDDEVARQQLTIKPLRDDREQIQCGFDVAAEQLRSLLTD